jgi:hypothetical protein
VSQPEASLDVDIEGSKVSMTIRLPEGGAVRTIKFHIQPSAAAELAMKITSAVGAIAQVSADELEKWVNAG